MALCRGQRRWRVVTDESGHAAGSSDFTAPRECVSSLRTGPVDTVVA